MADDLPPLTVYELLTSDFVDSWNCVASREDARGRGAQMFMRQAVGLLEWATMLASRDQSGAALWELSQKLYAIEPRYFTELPGPCANLYLQLPFALGAPPQSQLLWALFDLVRNGVAHQYVQINAELEDGGTFGFIFCGADLGLYLGISRGIHPYLHLKVVRSGSTVAILIRPDIFFLDLKQAIDNSRLLYRDLTFPYFSRPRRRDAEPRIPRANVGAPYAFGVDALEVCLRQAGHRVAPSIFAASDGNDSQQSSR